MQWLVEHSEGFGILDTNTQQMTDALQALGMSYETVKVVPFSHELIIPAGFDLLQPTLVYGSTLLASLAPSLMSPGAFYRPGMFDPRTWKHPRMLNKEIKTITAAELRSEWIAEPVFVKSVKDKLHTGMVLEPADRNWWLIEQTEPNGEDEMLISPVREITQEWRFFVVDGVVVAGSQYRHNGVRRIRETVYEWVFEAAADCAKDWLPHPTVVMDLCLVGEDIYVLEFNCLNSSGFYNSDAQAILKALERGTGFEPA